MQTNTQTEIEFYSPNTAVIQERKQQDNKFKAIPTLLWGCNALCKPICDPEFTYSRCGKIKC